MEDINEQCADDLKRELEGLLSEADDSLQEDEFSSETKKSREEVLSIRDVSLIGAEEYMIFLDYAIANLYEVMSNKIKVKKPGRTTIEEMAKEVISIAISTYDIEKATKANSTFRTHVGWKTQQVVTDYIRALVKANKNELNVNDNESAQKDESNLLKSDSEGNADQDVNADMPEYHRSDRASIEQSKKIEWAMKQVRFELPRQSNLILDVGIGEIYKSDDVPFTLPEWGEFTNQDPRELRRLFNASTKLIKQKLYRKGYMDIVQDQEKTSEDLLKDTNIAEQMKIQAQDENIIESTDIEVIMREAEEFLSSDKTNISLLGD